MAQTDIEKLEDYCSYWQTPIGSLPRPTGPFSVGFQDYEWLNNDVYDSKTGISGGIASSVLPVLVRFYYPSKKQTRKDGRGPEWQGRGYIIPTPKYHQSNWGITLKILYSLVFENYVGGHKQISRTLSKMFLSHKVLWAVEKAPLAVEIDRLPAVLFSHGLYGTRTVYSSICTQLASHGFLVAAMEHR